MTTNKKKTTTAIVAGVTAAALLLGGTFAWISVSQQARNEAIVDINPGGRLHDDFNGTNKDVYVENFSSGATGVDIYARIKLTEYMEVGPDAGKNRDAENRNVKVIYPEGQVKPDIEKPETWITYIPNKNDPSHTKSVNDTVYTNYWDWQLGRTEELPYYMPTFNMNKDSLQADINGTYEGTVEGDIVHYDNYVVYGPNDVASKEGTEIYDWDTDTRDEDGGILAGQYDNGGVTTNENDPIDDADVYHKENQTHTAKQISTGSTVITMAQWLELLKDEDENNDTGAFWVYDEDGWAYWAQPIKPESTTGLLLDSIEQIRVPDDNWYYGINVVGQFVTASDISAFKNENDGFSDNAKELMGKVAGMNNELVLSGPDSVIPGAQASYTAIFKAAGVALEKQPEVDWKILNVSSPTNAAALLSEDSGITISDGEVTVADDVAVGTTFEVSAGAGALTKTMTVTVVENYPVLKIGYNDTRSVPIEVGGASGIYRLSFEIPAEFQGQLSPSDITVESASIMESESYDINDLIAGEDYTYDPKTQTLTLTLTNTATETIYFRFCSEKLGGEEGGYYDLDFSVPLEQTGILLYNNGYQIVATVGEEEMEHFVKFKFYDVTDMDIGGGSLWEYFDQETMEPLDASKINAPLVEVENLTLSGEFNNGAFVDEESGCLYASNYLSAACLIGTYKGESVLVLVENAYNRQTIFQISLDKLTNTGDVYSGTIADGMTYMFMLSNSDMALESAEGHSLGWGAAITTARDMSTNSECSFLTLSDYYASDNMSYDEETDTDLPVKIYLTAKDTEGNKYQIVLTIEDKTIIEESVDITTTGDIELTSTDGKEGTITAAGSYDFDVTYETTLGVEATVKWTLSTRNGSGVTVDEATGTITVADGAEGTFYLTPEITSGDETIDYVSVMLTIEITN